MPTIYTTPPEVILEAGRLKGRTARQIHDEEIAREDARFQATLDFNRDQENNRMTLATMKEMNNERKNEIDMIKWEKEYGLDVFNAQTDRFKADSTKLDYSKDLKQNQARARIDSAETEYGGDYKAEQTAFKKSTQKKTQADVLSDLYKQSKDGEESLTTKDLSVSDDMLKRLNSGSSKSQLRNFQKHQGEIIPSAIFEQMGLSDMKEFLKLPEEEREQKIPLMLKRVNKGK